MQMETENLRKLDAGLLRLIGERHIVQSEQFPVFITVDEGATETIVVDLQAAGGTVRHVMEGRHCVAAWIPLELVPELASKPFVRGLDLSQRVDVA